MKIKVLKNKKFHIPTERIKEADKSIAEEETLRKRINEMTDEEYEEYVRQEIALIDENEKTYTEEEFWRLLNEDMELWQAEIKNYEKWKRFLEIKRNERLIRRIG